MEQTADESKTEHIAKMGHRLGSIYHHLWQETGLTYQLCEEYVELYGTKPERIDLLNEAAPRFFGMVFYVFWDFTLLCIARLTDASKGTLSLRRLPSLVRQTAKAGVEARLKEAIDRCAFAQDWRHRRIAHNSLDLMLNPTANPLTPASRLQVTQALDSIVGVLDAVSMPYLGSRSMFAWKGGRASLGAVALLHVLDDGIQTQNDWLARLERDEVDIADLMRREKGL